MSRLCHYRTDTGGPEPASAARRALTNRFYISSAATSPALGLLAMVAALARVRGNIRAFGVTPDPVTVAGESAGATCIGGLLGVPVARGLSAHAIRHSRATANAIIPRCPCSGCAGSSAPACPASCPT